MVLSIYCKRERKYLRKSYCDTKIGDSHTVIIVYSNMRHLSFIIHTFRSSLHILVNTKSQEKIFIIITKALLFSRLSFIGQKDKYVLYECTCFDIPIKCIHARFFCAFTRLTRCWANLTDNILTTQLYNENNQCTHQNNEVKSQNQPLVLVKTESRAVMTICLVAFICILNYDLFLIIMFTPVHKYGLFQCETIIKIRKVMFCSCDFKVIFVYIV